MKMLNSTLKFSGEIFLFDFNLPKVLAAYNIQTNEIIYQNRLTD